MQIQYRYSYSTGYISWIGWNSDIFPFPKLNNQWMSQNKLSKNHKSQNMVRSFSISCFLVFVLQCNHNTDEPHFDDKFRLTSAKQVLAETKIVLQSLKILIVTECSAWRKERATAIVHYPILTPYICSSPGREATAVTSAMIKQYGHYQQNMDECIFCNWNLHSTQIRARFTMYVRTAYTAGLGWHGLTTILIII